jgi:cell division septation protein DedD
MLFNRKPKTIKEGVMTNKTMAGLALGAGLIAFLAVVYMFYPGGAPQMSPGKPEAPGEVPYRTAPEFAGKPAVPKLSAPSVQEPPGAPPATTAPTPGEEPAASELKPPAAPPEGAPPPAPEEHYGLLMGRYRTHQDAAKVLEKVQKEGKPAFIRHDGRQRQPYSVWAGPFSSQEEAKGAAKAIKAKLKVAAKPEKLQMVIPK